MTDVGEYCREVEDYLTRINGGHLVRIVGPGFELVRGWAEEGIPLSVVRRGIDLKADRQRAGEAGTATPPARPRRPLRIEFCEADVRDVYDSWRRAVGLASVPEEDGVSGEVASDDRTPRKSRQPSLAKHLDRAIDRLARIAGSFDRPESLRDAAARVVEDLSLLRQSTKGARGSERDAAQSRLAEIDRALVAAAREAVPPADLALLAAEAERELQPFRARLPIDAWQHALDATVTRLLRDRLGLPVLELAE